MPRQFFPASDRPELVVDLTLPQNASIFASDAAAAKLDAILKGDPDVESWSTYVGRGAIRFYLPLDVKLANDFFAQAVGVAKDVAAARATAREARESARRAIAGRCRRACRRSNLGRLSAGRCSTASAEPTSTTVRAIALKLGEAMGENANLRLVNFDWIEPPREVRINIDQDQARLLGLSSQTLAEVLNTVMTGTPVTQVRDDIYLVNVIARATDEQRVSLSTLRSPAAAASGRAHRAAEPGRELRFRSGISADLAPRPRADPDCAGRCARRRDAGRRRSLRSTPAIEKLRESLARGYHIDVGGTVEESAQSQASVFALLPSALFLMLFFLMAQLHSFGRVVPRHRGGAAGADRHRRSRCSPSTGRSASSPFSAFWRLLGMIARNAVILIDQIETERRQGRDIWDAVVEATLSRFRPIVLTAISTVLGLIPIAPTVFWGPMAFAVMGGLFVATMLTLLVLPVFYITLYRAREPATTAAV